MSIFIRNIVSYNVVRDSRHTNIVYSTTTTKQKNVCLEALNWKKIPEMFSLLSRLLNMLSLGIKGSSSIQCIWMVFSHIASVYTWLSLSYYSWRALVYLGGHLEVCQQLFSYGADVDSQDNRKVSVLMAAFRKGHLKVIKWLVKHVHQFPSDSECTRFVSTLSDKVRQFFAL